MEKNKTVIHDEKTAEILVFAGEQKATRSVAEDGGGTVAAFAENGGTLSQATSLTVSGSGSVFIKATFPNFKRAVRIKKAEICLTKSEAAGVFNVGAYISGTATAGSTAPETGKMLDYAKITENGEEYRFDITAALDSDSISGSKSVYAALKALADGSVTFTSPRLSVTYDATLGLPENSAVYTQSLSDNVEVTADLTSGKIFADVTEVSWDGARLPFTLARTFNGSITNRQYTADAAYNIRTADFSAMHIGYGWKLGIMQSMVAATVTLSGETFAGYVYTDDKGRETFFKKKDGSEIYIDAETSGLEYDPATGKMTSGDTSFFFENGRLVKITDNYGNSQMITYADGKITNVADGAGRNFVFNYNESGFLTSVLLPDGNSVTYTYSGEILTEIIIPENRGIGFYQRVGTLNDIYIIDRKMALNLRKAHFNYDSAERVSQMKDYGLDGGEYVLGNTYAFTYAPAAKQTTVRATENDGDFTDTVYTYDGDGNLVGSYMTTSESGNVSSGGVKPFADGSAAQNVCNLLLSPDFSSDWTNEAGNIESTQIRTHDTDGYSKYALGALEVLTNNTHPVKNGVYQETLTLPAGDYTFSSYVEIRNTYNDDHRGSYLAVTFPDGTVIAESEKIISPVREKIRLTLPFTLTEATAVKVHLYVDGLSCSYFSCPQLERSSAANAYNPLANGNFEHGLSGWTTVGSAAISETEHFNMSKSLKIEGSLSETRGVYRRVKVKKEQFTRETFTLSGWAKGISLPAKEREDCPDPVFRLRAVVSGFGSNSDEFTADFSPATEGWQFASVTVAKTKPYRIKDIKVYCEYGYNGETAYFDDIQLLCESVEEDLSADDFTVEVEEEETTGTVTEETVSDDDIAAFEELLDSAGNALTETTFTDGEFGTLYRSFAYSENKNDLVRETDARGNDTVYTVGTATSRRETVTDRCGNKTAYEYDNAGRTTKITAKNSADETLSEVSYGYDRGNALTGIIRGDGQRYTVSYDPYRNLEAVKVGNTSLVTYDYKSSAGRLKKMTYANGDYMTATYNSFGQLVTEKWFDSAETLTAHYKYIYDGEGNIVRSLDILSGKEYNYIYEKGVIARANECNVTTDGKTIVSTVFYTYDKDGKLVKKRVMSQSGEVRTYNFENPEDGNALLRFEANGKTVTSQSKTDSFGRKVFEELQLGSGFVSRRFEYLSGDFTETHSENGKLKSSPTTLLVKSINFDNGRTVSYEYDAEERITKVTDSVDGITEYTYDALGQLLTEKHNNTVVNAMTYDNYGNIKTKNGVAYTYGNAQWKDLLTKVGNQTISYDNQGNPTAYLGHTLTWEKGRQLKSFDTNTYTYNANGIRTSKTVNGTTHNYILAGTKILRETWGENVLIPLYDNEDSVCGIEYNGNAFYFVRNLQNDIVAITDKDGETVARYTYDAWGACTIAEDTSEIGIATVNPFRYRGYYYDTEMGMYYLQSRYYDPTVGRFINADSTDILEYKSNSIVTNLFCYCENNPVNEVDRAGLSIAAKLAEIFLSAVFGAIAQLFDDLVIYFLRVLVHGQKNVKFEPNPSDYVSRALSWALECLNPFSGKKKWLKIIFGIIPVIVKTIWDIISGKSFSIWDILKSIFLALLGIIISNVLGRQTKNNISKIKKYYIGKKKKVSFNRQKYQIKLRFNIIGKRINTAIKISDIVVSTIFNVIVK